MSDHGTIDQFGDSHPASRPDRPGGLHSHQQSGFRSSKKTLVALGVAGALGASLALAGPALAQEAPAPPSHEQGHRPWLFSAEERQQFLAENLGVTVEEVEDAARAAHEQVVDQFGEIDPGSVDRDTVDTEQVEARAAAFREALAAELGVSVEDLDAAREAAFVAMVQGRVDSGDLSQEEADEIIDAFGNGTLREYLEGRGFPALSDRLADAVAAGNLSQEDADAILQHAEDGSLREYIRERRDAGDPVLPKASGLFGGDSTGATPARLEGDRFGSGPFASRRFGGSEADGGSSTTT